MKTAMKAAAALLATTAVAQAGGIERGNQSVGILFEEGRYVELGFTNVSPDISGVSSATTGSSGDIAPSYRSLTFRYRQDINANLSFALIGEEHIGAEVAYPAGAPYPIQGASASVDGYSLTGLLRYEFPTQFSVYGGVRVSRASGEASLPFAANYTLETNADTAVGFVAGVAYEVPEIALRVSLTYSSAYDHEFDATEGGPVPGNTTFTSEIPQSLFLEAQSGIAEDTLLFGSIRWVDWTEFDITPTNYTTFVVPGGSLVSYDDDTITYTIGVGRRFSDSLSGAVSVVYEPENNSLPGSNLGPTDGRIGLGIGGTYTTPEGVEISGGIQYSWLGNTITEPAVGTGTFEGNTTIAAGVTVGFSF
ncbi:MAG: hypothetical protein AAFN09_02725 [Pseudomonadota bacterium]